MGHDLSEIALNALAFERQGRGTTAQLHLGFGQQISATEIGNMSFEDVAEPPAPNGACTATRKMAPLETRLRVLEAGLSELDTNYGDLASSVVFNYHIIHTNPLRLQGIWIPQWLTQSLGLTDLRCELAAEALNQAERASAANSKSMRLAGER